MQLRGRPASWNGQFIGPSAEPVLIWLGVGWLGGCRAAGLAASHTSQHGHIIPTANAVVLPAMSGGAALRYAAAASAGALVSVWLYRSLARAQDRAAEADGLLGKVLQISQNVQDVVAKLQDAHLIASKDYCPTPEECTRRGEGGVGRHGPHGDRQARCRTSWRRSTRSLRGCSTTPASGRSSSRPPRRQGVDGKAWHGPPVGPECGAVWE